MMKIKGKEIPVSLFKFYLHDDMGKYLDEMKRILKLKTDAEVLSIIINHTYSELKAFKEHHLQKVNGLIDGVQIDLEKPLDPDQE